MKDEGGIPTTKWTGGDERVNGQVYVTRPEKVKQPAGRGKGLKGSPKAHVGGMPKAIIKNRSSKIRDNESNVGGEETEEGGPNWTGRRLISENYCLTSGGSSTQENLKDLRKD